MNSNKSNFKISKMFVPGAVSFDGVFIVLCVHGVGLVQILNVIIEASTSPDVPKDRRLEYLRYCISQYQQTFELVS